MAVVCVSLSMTRQGALPSQHLAGAGAGAGAGAE